MMLKRWCLLAAVAALAGCASMAPDYTRPAAPVPDAWPAGPAYKEGAAAPADRAVADIPWKEFFVDERLQKLIALALENNRDLRVALLAIERSRAQYQIQGAALYPKIEASAGGNLQRVPAGLLGRGRGGDRCTSTASASASAPTNWTSSAGCAASRTRRWSSTSRPSRRSAACRSAWSPRLPPPTWPWRPTASGWRSPGRPWPASSRPTSSPASASRPASRPPSTCTRPGPSWMRRASRSPATPAWWRRTRTPWPWWSGRRCRRSCSRRRSPKRSPP